MFKKYRENKELTQTELARLTDINIRSIQRIENGTEVPSVRTVSKIVNALEISDEDIAKYIRDFRNNF